MQIFYENVVSRKIDDAICKAARYNTKITLIELSLEELRQLEFELAEKTSSDVWYYKGIKIRVKS
jgi:hypothetical protein